MIIHLQSKKHKVEAALTALRSYFFQHIYLSSIYWDLEDAPNTQTAQKVVDKQTDKQTKRQTKHSTPAAHVRTRGNKVFAMIMFI